MDAEIKQYKERLRVALNAAKICIFEVDLVRQLYTFFENAEVIFGVSGEKILKEVKEFAKLEPKEYQAAVIRYFAHPEDEKVIEEAFGRTLQGETSIYEARMRAGGSGYVWCRIHIVPILEEGKPVRMVGVITDITDIKERTDRLKRAVDLDSFTGLYHKGYMTSYINEVLQKERQHRHALIVLDIDNFKNFNDTYGHAEGDKVIKAAAREIQNTFRKTDLAGRFGGDEFIIFIQDVEDDRWLRKKLSRLVSFKAEDYVCTNSIGVAFYPQDASDYKELFLYADMALYDAKIKKARYRFFSDLSRNA